MRSAFFFVFLLPMLLQAEPWGKDAELARHKPTCCHTTSQCPTPIVGKLAEFLIAFHQDVISPCDGPRSHFLPSSSQYTLEAIRKYGFLYGFLLGCDRLMRENDEEWVYLKGRNSGGQLMKLNPVR